MLDTDASWADLVEVAAAAAAERAADNAAARVAAQLPTATAADGGDSALWPDSGDDTEEQDGLGDRYPTQQHQSQDAGASQGPCSGPGPSGLLTGHAASQQPTVTTRRSGSGVLGPWAGAGAGAGAGRVWGRREDVRAARQLVWDGGWGAGEAQVAARALAAVLKGELDEEGLDKFEPFYTCPPPQVGIPVEWCSCC